MELSWTCKHPDDKPKSEDQKMADTSTAALDQSVWYIHSRSVGWLCQTAIWAFSNDHKYKLDWKWFKSKHFRIFTYIFIRSEHWNWYGCVISCYGLGGFLEKQCGMCFLESLICLLISHSSSLGKLIHVCAFSPDEKEPVLCTKTNAVHVICWKWCVYPQADAAM